MANRSTQITWTARKGRYGMSHPLEIPEGGCLEAMNVDFYNCSLGRKRAPLFAVSLTSGPTTAFKRLFLYIPGSSETAAKLVALEAGTVAGQNNIKVRAAGAWSTPFEETAADFNFTYASIGTARTLNGKCFLTGANTVKVLDSSGFLRQMGISRPAAGPTCADVAGGTPTKRYYRVAYIEQAGGVAIRRGELSITGPAGGYTPAAGNGARVTRPASVLGYPTHWELYASANDVNYFLIATTGVGTSTYDDLANPATYSGNQPPVVGDNTVPVNWKCIARDANRLLGWGSNTSSDKQSRLWYTPVLGSSYVGDEERVPSNNYLDIGEADGDYATALTDNIDGAIYAFKRRHLYRVAPTGDVLAPYVYRTISNVIGAMDPTSVIEGEDEAGNPCIYFVSAYGFHRVGSNGLENITGHVQDVFYRTTTPLLYHAERRQVWFSDTTLGQVLVYHVENGAWSVFKGVFSGASCASLYAVVPGTTALVPFVGSGSGAFLRYYADTGTAGWLDDGTTTYDSYVLTAPRAPFGLLRHVETQDPMIVVHVGDLAALRVTAYQDWAASLNYADVSCVAGGGLLLLNQQAENARSGGYSVIYYKVGDPPGTQQYAWKVDSIAVDVLEKEGL